MLDLSPGAETPMHRGESIDYNIVIEGEFDLVLDSGEVTRMRRGDVNIQRATNHKWINRSGDGKEPGRLFNVLVDIKPLFVNGQELKGLYDDKYPYGAGIERKGI
jgi:quercetin dioxygenase-like cupin family protein